MGVKNYGQRIKPNDKETPLDEEALRNISIDPFEDKDVEDFQNVQYLQFMSHFANCMEHPTWDCKFMMENHCKGWIDDDIAKVLDVTRRTIINRRQACLDCLKNRFNL